MNEKIAAYLDEQRKSVEEMVISIKRGDKHIYQVGDLIKIVSFLLDCNVLSLSTDLEDFAGKRDKVEQSAPYLSEYGEEDYLDFLLCDGGFIFAEDASKLVAQTECDNPKDGPSIYALSYERGVPTNENT